MQGPAQELTPFQPQSHKQSRSLSSRSWVTLTKSERLGNSAQAGEVTGRNDIWTPACLTPTYCPWILEQINTRNVGNWWFPGPQYLNSSVNFNNIKVTWTDITASQYDAIGSAQRSDKVLLPKKSLNLMRLTERVVAKSAIIHSIGQRLQDPATSTNKCMKKGGRELLQIQWNVWTSLGSWSQQSIWKR